MNWADIKTNNQTQKVLLHWQKLGKFRASHPAVGAGLHKIISKQPYVFSRSYSQKKYNDQVVIALDVAKGKKNIPTGTIFKNGTKVIDKYSGQTGTVVNNKVAVNSQFELVLLQKL